jgi:uncharacterized repeat protein (TIGR03806 family)
MRRVATVALGLALAACGGGDDDGATAPDAAPVVPDGATADAGPVDHTVHVDLSQPPPTLLSAYNFFHWDPASGFAFSDRVVPYDLNTALFSDYALKQRAIYVPEGAAASYDTEAALDLPVGSVVIKNFYFPADFREPTKALRLIETRLLVRYDTGWKPFPYIWDAEQKDAVLSPAGEVRTIDFIDAEGAPQTSNYLIPQRNQCASCHSVKPGATSDVELTLIGVKARHLNRSYDYGGAVGARNQLAHLAELGVLSGLPTDVATIPAAYDFRPIEAGGLAAIPPEDVEPAARAYLDINCAHCHNPNGVQGITSQLFLNHDNTDPFHLGVCKRPGSAGNGTGGFTFDIVPGDPDTSILYFRTHTSTVGAMMPLLGRSLTHIRGAELVKAWIAAMPAQACE